MAVIKKKKKAQVKTYRVLHDNMKVGNSVRNFGDLMPEAATFPNVRSYENAGQLEVIYVDQETIDDFYKELAEREAEELVEDEVLSAPVAKKPRKVIKRKTTKEKVNTNGEIREVAV